MTLRLKFNLILLAVFVPAVAIAGAVSWQLLQKHAREEVIHSANLMIEAARAIRAYTVDEVRPIVDQKAHPEFLPQTVPAYAATQTLGSFPDEFREFSYKEATLNPTNPRDRAADWEADIIQEFKRQPQRLTMSGVRNTPGGSSLYIASPIKITNEACLSCHSTASAAPVSLINKYGSANGFGWQMNEVVGAQIVSAPMSVAEARAQSVLIAFLGSLAALFVLVFVVLNIALNRLILSPVVQMSDAADKISTGDFSVPEFQSTRRDEVGALGVSFNRMRRSLEQAMKMMD